MSIWDWEFLGIYPSELKFPFELKRQSSFSMQLANKTDQYIPFKLILQAEKEFPPDVQCRDKFLVQSVIAPTGATNKDLSNEMVARSMRQPNGDSSSRENGSMQEQNQKLLRELELLQKRRARGQGGASIFLVLHGLVVGILAEYFIGT